MKKHFLFLVALVLGLGQLYADQVAFKASDLATITTEVTLPYTWKTESSSHVSVTLGGTGNLAVASPLNLNNGNSITVSVGGAGTVNVVTLSGSGAGNISANTGTYTPGTNSGTWAPGDATNSVTFTISAAVRLSKITVDYTPDPNYTPVEPATATMGDPIEAIAIDNINTYTGSEPYVYNRANRTYYALNSLGEYEEYGVFTEVNTLAVASAGLTEIEYIASNTTTGLL